MASTRIAGSGTGRPSGPTTAPGRVDRLAAQSGGGALDLAAVIAVGLDALRDLSDLPGGVHDGRLEEMLRASLERYRVPSRAGTGENGDTPAAEAAVAAARTACAYLATRSFEDAYFALRTAHDFLPRGRTRRA